MLNKYLIIKANFNGNSLALVIILTGPLISDKHYLCNRLLGRSPKLFLDFESSYVTKSLVGFY